MPVPLGGGGKGIRLCGRFGYQFTAGDKMDEDEVVMRSAGLRAILIGGLVAAPLPAVAFENFDLGKSPEQLFNSDCGLCHQSPAGLAATMSPGALAGYLSEHYTASKDIAGVLASYLVSVGKERRQSIGQERRKRRHARPCDTIERATSRRVRHRERPNAGDPTVTGSTARTGKPD
jgi:hypothetical protein